MMRIVSILSKLFKTVGLLAVGLNLAELQWKNRKKYVAFLTKIGTLFFCYKYSGFWLP